MATTKTTTKTTNRFIIANHDKVYNTLKARFEAMPCFQKYKSYTNSNNLPKFVREIEFA